MAKFSRSSRHGGLSQTVRLRLKEWEKPEYGYPFIANYLVGKLKLPKEKLERAKGIHSRLVQIEKAHLSLKDKKPIRAFTAKIILEEVVNALPEYIEAYQQKFAGNKDGFLDAHELTFLKAKREQAKMVLKQLQRTASDKNVFIEDIFCDLAGAINARKLVMEIGDHKKALLDKAILNALSAIAR